METAKLSVIGLGYVGLPLAVALSEHFRVVGFDIDADRIAELKDGEDRTREVSRERLVRADVALTHQPEDLRGTDVFIVTVPTPVDEHNRPDLSAVIGASRLVGQQLGRGALVVYESTVWPGVTEDICGPELERASGLTRGADFHLGYSPERINPGDREHSVERITKVVAGETPEVAQRLTALYGAINDGNIYVAQDIRTAEAAKVIENAQRDINIAFVNEVAKICHKLGIATHDVLDAAETKWNFLKFRPGLVGGHCIGVDPYYLAHRAVEIGHDPEVILAGRRINDGMGKFVADSIAHEMGDEPGRVLVLGLTFKENVPDLRNTRVVDIVHRLHELGHRVDVHDPLADPDEAKKTFDINILPDIDGVNGYACVIGAVAHEAFGELGANRLAGLLVPNGLLADLRGMWRHIELPDGIRRWTL